MNYDVAKSLLFDKDKFVANYVDNMLVKINEMFHYENLPEGLTKRRIERILTRNGHGIFIKENGKYYVVSGVMGGKLNPYYEPTEYIVSNPYLNLYKTFTINTEKDDCVMIRNDTENKGLIDYLMKYAFMCCDSEITLSLATVVLRAPYLISSSDSKGTESAKEFMRKMSNGESSIIAETPFLEGVKVNNANFSTSYVSQLIELNQYLRATAYNEIGLNANYNMKRERLSESEVDLNESILIPLAENMLECRKEAVEKINKMFNLEIGVELSSVWKMEKETVDEAIETVKTETDSETEETEETNVSRETEETEETEETDSETEETEETESDVSHETEETSEDKKEDERDEKKV